MLIVKKTYTYPDGTPKKVEYLEFTDWDQLEGFLGYSRAHDLEVCKKSKDYLKAPYGDPRIHNADDMEEIDYELM